MKMQAFSSLKVERCVLVSVTLARQDKARSAASLVELERLSESAGTKVVGIVTQNRELPTANFFVGSGKLEEIQMVCREAKADLVIFNNELSPVQVNNLDFALGIKVIDRTELILQIFATRVRSAESKSQVELAQLEYLITRIPVSKKQHRFSGGIGMRGPGETPLTLRNAPMRRRIRDLKQKLQKIGERRARTTSKRKLPMVCLVGYTNAGKSTLLNALTSSHDAYVDDRVFATLDTKTRIVHVGQRLFVLVSDTVGFISDLPHSLVASFRSTLDVARDADLLLVVSDVSDPSALHQMEVVYDTLKEIGAGTVKALNIFNKCDLDIEGLRVQALLRDYPDALSISASSGAGIADLKKVLCNDLFSSNADR